MNIHDVLVSLRDVTGVYGSFIVNSSGLIVNRDFPISLSNLSISQAGTKICRMWDTVGDQKVDYINLIFKFHVIHIRKFKYGSICIYIPPKINMLTLAGASGIATRALEEMAPGQFAGHVIRKPNTNTIEPAKDSVIYRGVRYG